MDSPLSPYRVLDLCGTLGCLTGKILGELGADVIRVEPPGGDPCRMTGPFQHNQPHPERSLSWLAYNSSKRGVTLDIAAPKGRALLLEMAAKADFLLESFPPGYLKGLDLDHGRLRRINPGLIHVSIPPFGQEGPYAGYAAGDLEITALSGAMSLAGEPGGVPLRIGEPQSAQWAGAEAAMGALIALFHRNLTGVGQHVDVSAQAAAMSILAQAPAFWNMLQVDISRAGAFMTGRNVHGAKMRVFWPVRDGWVNFILYGGNAGLKTNRGLVEPQRYTNIGGVIPISEGGDVFDLADAIAYHGLPADFQACYIRLTDGGTAIDDYGNFQTDQFKSGADIDAVGAFHYIAAPGLLP